MTLCLYQVQYRSSLCTVLYGSILSYLEDFYSSLATGQQINCVLNKDPPNTITPSHATETQSGKTSRLLVFNVEDIQEEGVQRGAEAGGDSWHHPKYLEAMETTSIQTVRGGIIVKHGKVLRNLLSICLLFLIAGYCTSNRSA